MPFPEFEKDKKKILFFTRGRGRGHAIPDMEIAREVEALSSKVEIRFVSYGTGARTFEAHGIPHIDLGLPDRNPINETIVLAAKLIGWLDPDLVVAHEEFMALPAAKIFDKPTVLITDWFVDPEKYSMTTLRFADRILFLDEPGIYEEPEWVRGRVEYLGPLIRKFRYSGADRGRAREELDINAGTFVIVVLPGSWREAESPILDLVVAAFDLLPDASKRLIWMASDDRDLIREKVGARADIDVRGYEPEIDRILIASDVAITKGTRRTLFELASLGIPSVSLVCIENPIDKARVGHFSNNEALREEADGADLLVAIGRAKLRRKEPLPPLVTTRACAERLLTGAECGPPADSEFA
jgi:UDP:flavonoid glycosyltransferase YjiC (YdhE family)